MPKKLAATKSRGTSPRKQEMRADQEKIAATIVCLDNLRPKSAKAAKAISLFKSWLADESGFDEKVWPRLKKALAPTL
jgi:hypothetical protein